MVKKTEDHLGKNIEKKAFGRELLIDLYDCNPKFVGNLDFNYNLLEELVIFLNMHKQSPPFIFVSPTEYPDKAGLSGWVPLIESGIQIHTLTVKNFVSIDIYTCGEMINEEVLVFLKDKYQAKKIESQFLLRGISYFE